jgi:hypothetical protein
MSGYSLEVASCLRKLDLFVPNARGPAQEVIRLTFQAANQTFPLLNAIVDETGAVAQQYSMWKNSAKPNPSVSLR